MLSNINIELNLSQPVGLILCDLENSTFSLRLHFQSVQISLIFQECAVYTKGNRTRKQFVVIFRHLLGQCYRPRPVSAAVPLKPSLRDESPKKKEVKQKRNIEGKGSKKRL